MESDLPVVKIEEVVDDNEPYIKQEHQNEPYIKQEHQNEPEIKSELEIEDEPYIKEEKAATPEVKDELVRSLNISEELDDNNLFGSDTDEEEELQ